MTELIAIGSVILAGFFLSGAKDKTNEKEREVIPKNEIPNSNDRVIETLAYEKNQADIKFRDAGDPKATNIIPRNYNRDFVDGKKNLIIPINFPESEGVPFAHENMVPFIRGNVKQNLNDNSLLEQKQGGGQVGFYKPKKETNKLFADMPNREHLHQEHRDIKFIEKTLTKIQNGVKPFQEIRVAPGLGRGTDLVSGRDGFHYGNFQVRLPTVNELRVKGDQQKEEFKQSIASGPVSYVKNRGLEFEEIPKNRPETFFSGSGHQRNPGYTGPEHEYFPTKYTKVEGVNFSREIGNELPQGPPGTTDFNPKDNYGIDNYYLRAKKNNHIESRPTGPPGALGGKQKPIVTDYTYSVDLRNNKTSETMVYNHIPTPVGNKRSPENLANHGLDQVRADNTKMHRPDRVNVPDRVRSRDTKTSLGLQRQQNNLVAFKNPRVPEGWETEQFRQNPFTQSLSSVV